MINLKTMVMQLIDGETDNASTPSPRVNPYKEERVESLHKSILFRMEVLGYDLDRVDEALGVVNAVFHTKKNGVRASGRYDKDAGRFTVLAGSEIELSREMFTMRLSVATRCICAVSNSLPGSTRPRKVPFA